MSTTPAPTVTPRLPATVGAAASKQGLGGTSSWALSLALLAISWKGADMRPADLVRDSGNMATYLADFFPQSSVTGATTCKKCWSPCRSPSGALPLQ